MRFQSSIIILLTIAFSGCLKKSTEISGKLHNPVKGEYIFVDQIKSNELVTVDSVMVADDGSFKTKIKNENPAFYLLRLNKSNFLTILAAPGENIFIESQHDSLNIPIMVKGSDGTRLMIDYNKKLQGTIAKMNGLNAIYMQNRDSTNIVSVISSLDSLAQVYLSDLNTYTKSFIEANLSSLVSLFALYQQVAPSVYVLHPAKDIRYFEKVDSSLSKLYPDYEPVKTLHQQVQEFLASAGPEAAPAVQPGAQGTVAPEISLPDPAGDTIKLSSTKGSYVLLDFWASWCGPCRQENPNLVKAWNLYHSKGFRIYQVSLDKTKDAWLKGIKDDHLEKWIHVSDVKYWKSEVVPLYRLEKIPTNFLLDREGRIIAVDLRGENLQARLAELFKK